MKIEIEGSIDDVLDILRAIAGIPKAILKNVEQTITTDPIPISVKEEPAPEPFHLSDTVEEASTDWPEPAPNEDKFPTKPNRTRVSSKTKGGGGGGGKLSRKIDVFVGEEGKGFSLDACCNSISSAARHIGALSAANIHHYVDSGKIYKGKYKFISRKI